MNSNSHLASQFGQMADDFFFCIIMLKGTSEQNRSLPFLHAHVLELSAKAACYKLGISIAGIKTGHDILSIYDLLKPHLPNLTNTLPATSHLRDYKKIWFPGNTPMSNVTLPPPDEFDNLELAYYVDNVMNLKYGFTKQLVQIDNIQLSYKEVNSKFLTLFTTCRNVYADVDMNQRIKGKIYAVFGQSAETERKIATLLKI